MKALKPISLFLTTLLSTAAVEATEQPSPTVQEKRTSQAASDVHTATLIEQPQYRIEYVERKTFQRLKDFFITKEKVAYVYRRRAGKIVEGIESNDIYFLSEVQRAIYERNFEQEYGVNFNQFKEVQITRKEVDFKMSAIKSRKFKIV